MRVPFLFAPTGDTLDQAIGSPPFLVSYPFEWRFVITGKLVQGGDISARGDGRGGESAYGGMFDDESFEVSHERGVLSMANSGANKNGSQFFVCLKRMPSLNGKHVAFGRVVSGLRVRASFVYDLVAVSR